MFVMSVDMRSMPRVKDVHILVVFIASIYVYYERTYIGAERIWAIYV